MTAIPWQNVVRGLKRAEELGLEPHIVAGVDQAAASIRRRFTDHRLPLDRPHNVYAGLVVCDVLHEGVLSARRVGSVCPHGAEDALVVIKGLEFALALAAPIEARPTPPTEGDRP